MCYSGKNRNCSQVTTDGEMRQKMNPSQTILSPYLWPGSPLAEFNQKQEAGDLLDVYAIGYPQRLEEGSQQEKERNGENTIFTSNKKEYS